MTDSIGMGEGVSLKQTGNIFLTDPPYFTQPDGGKPSSAHEVIPDEYMVDILEMVDDFLVYVDHSHISCSTRPFSKWFRVLVYLKMDVPDTSDAYGKKILDESVLTVEKKPPIYICDPDVYFTNSLSKT